MCARGAGTGLRSASRQDGPGAQGSAPPLALGLPGARSRPRAGRSRGSARGSAGPGRAGAGRGPGACPSAPERRVLIAGCRSRRASRDPGRAPGEAPPVSGARCFPLGMG